MDNSPDEKACRETFPYGNCGKRDHGCTESSHGHYQLILADPPWNYKVGGKKYQGQMPYKGMRMSELAAIPVHDIAERDSVLLMWATGPFLPQAIKLIEEWNFTYKTMFAVWRKVYASGMAVRAPGHYTRPCHEFILLGTRGRVSQFKRSANLSQLIETDSKKAVDWEHALIAERTGHSVKPREAFELLEEFFVCERRIELFARCQQPGYDAWGLELPGYFIKNGTPPAVTSSTTAAAADDDDDESDPGCNGNKRLLKRKRF